MRSIAYLVNRYPEASLTAIRREIGAVSEAGISVLRFAHRPSDQPLAGDIDSRERASTEYLAIKRRSELALTTIRVAVTRPFRFLSALRDLCEVEPLSIRSMGYLVLACSLLEKLRARNVELLQVHFGLTSAVVAMLTARLGGPRWCMTIHGPEEFEASNHKRLKRLVNSAAQVVAISHWAASAVQEATKPVATRPCVIGLGVGSAFLAPPKPIQPGAPIACIARLAPRKGHLILLKALSRLRDANTTIRVELFGDGPCRAQIESELRRRDLTQFVTLRGWLREAEIVEAIDRSRFLVLPSLSEGLPVIIMEAFARARPVLVTDVAGIRELVQDDVNGIVVPAGDPGSLAIGLAKLNEMSPDRLCEFGSNGRRLVEGQFNSEKNARALIAVWKKVVASGS